MYEIGQENNSRVRAVYGYLSFADQPRVQDVRFDFPYDRGAA